MIIITGASDGLGLQLAKLYKESGKKVVNVSRSKCVYADVNIQCDFLDEAGIKTTTDTISEMSDEIEALINCAGVFTNQKLGTITAEVIDRVLSINYKSQILIVSAIIDRLKKDRTDIMNVSSTVGTKGRGGETVYSSSKWAVRGFTKSLQEDLKDTNRVISFCPGGFKTKFFEKGTGVDNTGDGSEWMKPEDLAIFMKQILDLPKNMEVSEVIINRKAIK
ncbi:SDR family oxidoreductase [Candidatus Saccharibacteria bacterium]|nr:SDR family oxidoreductase [Candidatus Saccharibacteria bacterium]